MFNSLTEKEKYYILGLLYADGCSIISPRWKVILKMKDEQIIADVSKVLGANYRKCKEGAFEVSLYGKEKTELWIDLGIVPRKTYLDSPEIFDKIPDEYKRDFVRGLFDGDGCISKRGVLSITGLNKSLLNRVSVWLEKETGKTFHVKNENNAFRLKAGIIKVVDKVIGTLYYIGCIHLFRKKNIFLEIKNNLKPIKGYSFHRSSGRYRITLGSLRETRYFNTELECIEFIKEHVNESTSYRPVIV